MSAQAWGVQRPLFLTGMMGCGKTTVGRVLAHDHERTVVDLDERIERLFGRTVAELFGAGEASFREHEHQALRSLLAEPGFGGQGTVVTCGGGTVLDRRNRDAMDAVGTRVYLEVGVDELVRRLLPTVEADPDARPLLKGEPARVRARLGDLLAARRSLYRAGSIVVDAEADPVSVAERIVAALDGVAQLRDSEAV
ncbi:MAG: shikimate kinase [Myxococcota bacterium]